MRSEGEREGRGARIEGRGLRGVARWAWRGFFVALWLLLPSASWGLEWVSLLDDDASAVQVRVAKVLSAEDEVFVSTFIVGKEPFSMTAMALLRSATRRGLDVRLLVDAQWNKMPEAVEAHLLAEGVAIRRFHPFRLCHPLWVTKRLHDKLVIVDGEDLILGGRNIEGPYFGFGRQLDRRDYIDLDLLVRGEAAQTARTYFLAVWDSRHTAASRAEASKLELEQAEAELDRHQSWLEQRIDQSSILPSAAVGPPPDWVEDVYFFHDPVQGKGSGPGVGTSLLEWLETAQESVVLESPYLIPTRSFRRGLARAIDRGVRVRILTNSVVSTDNLWAQAGYVGMRKRLVRMGVELWEYEGPESIHTKAGLLDDRSVLVGSFNLDPRSANLNTEVAVAFESPKLALEVEDFLDEHLERSRRIDSRGWPEGSDHPYPGISKRKVLRLRLLRLLAPLIRSQL